MDAKKALIITWVVIGFVLAGLAGFYLGKSNLGKGSNQLTNTQGPGTGQVTSGGGNQQSGNNIQQPGQGGQQVITPPAQGVKK